MEEVVTNLYPQRWQPDSALRFAALDGRVTVTRLPKPDRAWLVATLTHEGMTTDVLAEKLHCSRRTVQQIRCDPVAVLVTELLLLESEVAKVKRRAAANDSAGTVTQLVHQIDDLKRSKSTLIDQLSAMRKRCMETCPPPVIVMSPVPSRVRDSHGRFAKPVVPVEQLVFAVSL